MPIVTVTNVGALGIMHDIPSYELPPEAFTLGANVRFKDNRAEKFLGHKAVFGAPSGAPYFLLCCPSSSAVHWLYGGLTKVWGTDMTSHADISKTATTYTTNQDTKWNGVMFGGIPVINNGNEVPQVWAPISLTQLLIDIPNWGTWPTANTRCRVLRSFRNFLIAMDITEASRDPLALAWSHPAPAGAVPSSWNYTDPTKDATKIQLSESGGAILDCLRLGGTNVVYKEDWIYSMQFVGGEEIFRFDTAFRDIGMMATNCMAFVPGRGHLVVTHDDIVIHDLKNMRSILDGRRRTTLFATIDASSKQRSFVVVDYKRTEVWFCYPETGAVQPTRALTWNWVTEQLGDRQLGAETAHIGLGVVNPSAVANTWDSDGNSWDSDLTIWDQRTYDPAFTSMLMGRSAATAALYLADETNQFAGSNFTSFVERKGISIVGKDRQGNPKVDLNSVKFISRVLPRMKASGAVQIYVGGQMDKEAAIQWNGPFNFNPNTDLEIFADVTARLPAIRVESTADVSWELYGYDLDMKIIGRY